MPAETKADRYRRWAANAAMLAMQAPSAVDRETLLMIARRHLAVAIKADQRKKISGSTPACRRSVTCTPSR